MPVEFNLTTEKRQKLIEKGYLTTIEYFTKTLLEKKKRLLPQYQVILDNLIKTKNFISANKAEKAKCQLCELFVYLCESKRCIDLQIYNDIAEFKNFLFKNIHKSFFGKTTLKETRQIIFYLNKINTQVLNKCIELDEYIKEFEKPAGVLKK